MKIDFRDVDNLEIPDKWIREFDLDQLKGTSKTYSSSPSAKLIEISEISTPLRVSTTKDFE